jgi:hypothetical protein
MGYHALPLQTVELQVKVFKNLSVNCYMYNNGCLKGDANLIDGNGPQATSETTLRFVKRLYQYVVLHWFFALHITIKQ